MTEKFKHYLPLKEEEYKHIFEECYFVLDTNVLINFYRYSDNTTNKFFNILEKLKNRLYLPYQIGNEFFNNRLGEINAQKSSYKEMVVKICDIKKEFENKNRNPFLSEENLSLFDKIITELQEKEQDYSNLKKDDKILARINLIFQNSGDEFYDYEKIIIEGRKRYKDKIPPGYKDDDKPADLQKYGDLIIWKDLLTKSNNEKKPCIFITDDNKEDWWLLDKNKNIIAPRPELRKEFLESTGQMYYSYQPFNFLDVIQKHLNVEVEDSVIEEVKNNSSDKDSNFSTMFIDKYVHTLEDSNFMHFISDLGELGYHLDIQHLNVKDGVQGYYYRVTVALPEFYELDIRLSRVLESLAAKNSVRIVQIDEVEFLANKYAKFRY